MVNAFLQLHRLEDLVLCLCDLHDLVHLEQLLKAQDAFERAIVAFLQ